MEILILLLECQGGLVSRQEIAATLWPGSDPADRVDSINTAINRIRVTLGDDPAKPRYIQTIIGKGYRFMAEVQVERLPGAAPALQTAASHTAPAVSPSPMPIRSRRLAWFITSAALVAIFVIIATYRWRHRIVPSPVAMTRITSNLSENSISAASISADGHLLAYADADGVQYQEIGDVRTLRVLSPKLIEIDQLAWSVDQKWLLLSGIGMASRQPEVWRLPLDGTTATLIKIDARAATFSPDGLHIAYTSANGSGISICDAGGRNAREVLAGQSGQTFSAVLWMRDGKNLIAERHTPATTPFQAASPTRGYTAAYIVADAGTGHLRTVLNDVRFNHGLLTADNRFLFTRADSHDDADSSSLWTVSIDPITGAFTSRPDRLQSWTERRVLALDHATQTGEIIAVLRQGRFGVYVADFIKSGPKLENVRRLSQDDGVAYPHAWTPDSRTCSTS